jgi:phage/plasmid-like protein (TIGR03299 family)
MNADGTRGLSVYGDRMAHVRSDTQECIGIGSPRFKLVQPGDALEFFRTLVEGSQFTIETAGALAGGSRIWALARCDMGVTFGGKDKLIVYLLLVTANDGSLATEARFTTVRVVCNNTLQLAVGQNDGLASIKVPHSTNFDADAVHAELGLVGDAIETFAADADILTQATISDETARLFFESLYAKTDSAGEITNKRNLDAVTRQLMTAYKRGPGAELATANGTLWGAVNAVTHHVDFNTRARSASNRFNSGQFGNGANVKARAFNQALELVAA